ncbi:MAG: asparagine synthase-related protein, partial [Actinomycetota bacterium]|nr:asparagine synthase-related protein [Actinomycetota bacterium]
VDVWVDGPVGLANAMLRTTPESAEERLPLVEDHLALAADARIDNRGELIGELRLPPSVPDSGVILAAYRRWGDRCPERLIGDFAFAVWDARRRTFLLARDHIGVRPLVWFRSRSLFAFASQERALFTLAEVPRRLDEIGIGDFLVAVLEDTQRTFYEDVHRLPPHHALSLSAGGDARSRSYWELDASRELRLASDREYEEAFRETFVEAVRARTRSLGPVATELSGGLDSSAVTCAMRDLRGAEEDDPVPAFSIVFEDPGSDERTFVDAVAATGGIRPTKLGGDDLLALRLEDLLSRQDGPFASLTVLMETALCARAAESGRRVLLGGFDGDVVVSHGLERLPHLLRRGRWGTLGSEVTQLAPRLGLSRWEALRSYAVAPAAPPFAHRLWGAAKPRGRRGWSGGAPIAPGFARRIGLSARSAAFEGPAAATAREEHRAELSSGVLPAALEIRDRVGAAAGVELRHPFFDVRLVELCLSLPEDQKMRNGWTRSIQRRALAGIVPERVLWRSDKGRINDRLLVDLVRAERASLDRSSPTTWGGAGAFLDLPQVNASVTSGEPGDLPGLWQALTLARWMEISFPRSGEVL